MGWLRCAALWLVMVRVVHAQSAEKQNEHSSPFHTDLVGSGPIETPSAEFQTTDAVIIEPAALTDAADDDSFPDTVIVGNDETFYCTGVLLDQRHVLTAAHCADATRVGFGNTVAKATQARVSSRSTHPALDVAVLTLAKPAVVRTHVRRTRLDTTPPTGTIRVLGFGVRDRLRLTGFGTKRQLDVAVDGWGCSAVRASVLGCSAADELLVRGGQGNDTCLGDSGGPVYELVDDKWRLLAITSRGMRPRKVICGEGGIYVRVDRISRWLEKEVGK